MKQDDISLFVKGMAPVIRDYVAVAFIPITDRLDAIEHRLNALPDPPDPEIPILRLRETLEARLARFEEDVKAAHEKAEAAFSRPNGTDGKDGRDGVDGKSVTAEELVPLIAEHITRAVADLPRPQDGQNGKDGRDGTDGRSIAPEELAPLIAEQVRRAVADLPAPKDGAPGRDGVNLAGAVIDREGNLIITLSNGEQRSLGGIVGRDGAPGAPGKDGHDGLGFEDVIVGMNDRTLSIRFERGEQVKEFAYEIPVPLYRGVYKPGIEYREGDSVTYAGSQFYAKRATAEKPETGDDWQLAVKRGRDGKDGKDGAPGIPGPEGRPGRDLTQLAYDGRKT